MLYLFDDFALDCDRRELRRGGDLVRVEPQVFDLLMFLVRNRNRVVSKDDLIASVWGGRIVSESTIDSRINAARRVVGDNGRDQRLLRTIIGRGVRFIAEAEERDFASASRVALATASAMAREDKIVAAAPRRWPRAGIPAPATPITTVTKPAPRLSIVVLPFANLSDDPDQDYFVDAITDGLTTDLSRIANSFVIARTTAFTYKGKAVDVRQVGAELSVRYVLEGSVRRSGEDVQIIVQLIDAETRGHLWSDRIVTDRSHLTHAQNDIIARLAQALHLEALEAAGRRIEREGAVNVDAQDLVMRGWAVFNRPQPASLPEAQQLFERALAADSESVDARLGIAAVLNLSLAMGASTDRSRDLARSDQLLSEAFDRDRSHAQVRTEIGWLRRLQGRLLESQIELATALSLDPNNTLAMNQLGITLLYLGRPDESLVYFERYRATTPLNYQNLFYVYFWLGESHLLLGQPEKAIEFLEKSRAENPNLPWTHLRLAAALALTGNIDEARKSLAEFQRQRSELSSLKQMRAFEDSMLWERNPRFIDLREKNIYTGLGRAGMPEE